MVKNNNILLSVKDLKIYFRSDDELARAVDGVSFDVGREETVCLVGESGCGKSTVGNCILRLLEPTSGSVEFDGQNVFELNSKELKSMRRNVQVIFQDP
jgi:ABC-type oligopeptide transport system ATPase subunit